MSIVKIEKNNDQKEIVYNSGDLVMYNNFVHIICDKNNDYVDQNFVPHHSNISMDSVYSLLLFNPENGTLIVAPISNVILCSHRVTLSNTKL